MDNFTELINSKCYKNIESDIEVFVKEKLKDYNPDNIDGKTIHDSVWGSVEYSEWEMQIIDSPLFQRLRDINQVGLALFTYPAARHSRFEHSLGVLAAAKKMCEKISNNSKDFSFDDEKRNSVYLAALLHDIGHCFYSHLSESIYCEFKAFMELRLEFNKKLDRKPKAHEILSFMIINTETFKKFFLEKVNYLNKNKQMKTLFRNVGLMIIGAYIEEDNKIYSYLTSIINGPFDADKLDYIKRDSLTAGLSLTYDIERLFTKIIVHPTNKDKNIEYRLAIKFNGITAIEELTFCKIMLFSYIYYHQKVLISETMIKDYVMGLCKLKIINSFADFLRYTDSNIQDLANKQGDNNPFPKYPKLDLKSLADNIKYRKLPKRCFELSQTNVIKTEKESNNIVNQQCQLIIDKFKNSQITADELEQEIISLASISIMKESPVSLDLMISELRELTYFKLLEKRHELYLKLVDVYNKKKKKINFNLFDIYIVFPVLVSYGSVLDKVVLGKDNKNLITINDFVKLDDWADSFNSNKWRGYVFVSEKIDRTIAFKVAEEFILRGKIKINNPEAFLKGVND